MTNDIQKIENYEIPKRDTIYRNKNMKYLTAAEIPKFMLYLDPFLIGSRKIHTKDIINITDGYILFVKFLISERSTNKEQRKAADSKINELKKKFLKIQDIANGYDQPFNPDSMKLSEIEIDEWRDEIIERDKYGHVESIKHQKLGTKLLNRFEFIYIPNFKEFLYYDESCGYFRPGAREFISQKAREILKEESTTYIVNEVVSYVRDLSLTNDEEFKPAPGLINMKNGVYDWKGRRLLAHSSEYHFRTSLPFSYNIHARKSQFFKVLQEITQDDLEKALIVLEVFGWMLIPGYPIQKAVAFFGTGNNGKSVILNFIQSFLGRENVSNTPLQTLCNNRFAVPGLRGKIANISGDVGSATLYDTSTFKQLTGGDEVEGEIKGLQSRPKFMNEAKMVFAFNRLPNTWDQSKAFYRRFKLVELIQDFSNRDDKDLINKITKESDLQAVFNLIVEVFLPALASKLEFHNQETVEETTQRYKINSNPGLAFVEEMLEPNPDSEVEGRELYNLFTDWCKREGISPISPEAFGRTLLKNSEMAVYHKLKQKDGVRSYYYIGINIKDTDGENGKSDQVKGNDKKNMITLKDALNYYVKTYCKEQSDHGSYVFYTLKNKLEVIQYRNIEKTYEPYAPKNFNLKQIQSSTEEKMSDHVFSQEGENLITSADTIHEGVTNEALNHGITEKLSDENSLSGLYESYKYKQVILETALKIPDGKKGAWISPSDILENIVYSSDSVTISLEDLNERCLPSLAAEGLIAISNGKIMLTGKGLNELKPKEPNNREDSNKIRYIFLSILENINLAAEDGRDYCLKKGDAVHVPEVNANLLIERGWARKIQPQESKKENNQVPPFQNDSPHSPDLQGEPTKSDVQNENSNNDEKPETVEPITMKQADEIKNMLLRSGIHLKATDTGISISGDRYNIGVPVSYYRQNSDMIDQAMSKWNLTKKNEGALGTVFFDIPLKKEVQP